MDSNLSITWTLRLRAANKSVLLKECHANTSFEEFQELACNALELKKHNLKFLVGFPPKEIQIKKSDKISQAISNNENIVVKINTASIAERVSAKNKRKGSVSPIKKKTSISKGIHGVHGNLNLTKKKKKNSFKNIGDGYRLGSSDSNEETSLSEQNAPKKRTIIKLSSKEDIESKLITSAAGCSGDKTSKFLRCAAKKAVGYQYQVTKATTRLKAALSQEFTVEEIATSRYLGINRPVKLKVRFKNGQRTWNEENIEYLDEQELRSIVKYILLLKEDDSNDGRENLKAFNMAQCSPRVFWNIARLYQGNIENGLKNLLPDEDWSFLIERTRQLSEKAMEAKNTDEYLKQEKLMKKTLKETKQASTLSKKKVPNTVRDIMASNLEIKEKNRMLMKLIVQNEDILQILIEAKIHSPKDLKVTPCDLTLKELKKHQNSIKSLPSLDEVDHWKSQALLYLEEYPSLYDYIPPHHK